jgi:hypothetical protein
MDGGFEPSSPTDSVNQNNEVNIGISKIESASENEIFLPSIHDCYQDFRSHLPVPEASNQPTQNDHDQHLLSEELNEANIELSNLNYRNIQYVTESHVSENDVFVPSIHDYYQDPRSYMPKPEVSNQQIQKRTMTNICCRRSSYHQS